MRRRRPSSAESLVERMSRRVRQHPYAVVLSFVATVALPLGTIAFSTATTSAAIVICMLILGALLYFLGREPCAETEQTGPNHHCELIPESPVELESQNSDQVRRAVRKWMLHHFGDVARLDYYTERANAANQYDPMYRETVESLLGDATWGSVAHGAQEWVAIGFETLVNWRSSWNNEGTKNELYRAVVDSLLTEDLNLNRGVDFADHVKATVAARRLNGE